MPEHWLVCGIFPRQRAPDGRRGIYSHNYHAAWCRYRQLQAEVVRLLVEEVDPLKRARQEERVVDMDQLFDAVCPQCREPVERLVNGERDRVPAEEVGASSVA